MTTSDRPFLAHEGVAAALIRSIDWRESVLGAIEGWPHSLVALIGTMLHSRHPMFLWWGPELIQFYNDAYLPSFGQGKHPLAMGQRGKDCWPEIWPIIGPQIDEVMRHARASWHEDALVPIERNGRIEEVYWTYGYSPAFDDAGRVGGTLVVCTETTQRVLGARRGELIRRLSEHIAACVDAAEVLPATLKLLGEAPLDIPFCELRALESIDGDGAAEQVVSLQPPRLGTAWPEPVTEAVLLRCSHPEAALSFGVSPRLPLDASYLALFSQIVEEVEQATARLEAIRARAVAESERRNLIMQAPIATAIVTGKRHVYQLTNPRYQEMIGGRDVIGKAYVEAFPEVAGTEVEAIMDRVYATGEPYLAQELLVPIARADKGVVEDVYFRFNLEPVRDARGVIYGIMAIALDITPEVTARRVVEKAAQERERLLTQLEAAGHAKDEFLATVSHELRTPLTSILGWARLLREGGDEERVKKGLSAIERNAKAQAQLIEDILDVSRIVSGKMRLNLQKLEPAGVVQAAVESARSLATAKQQRLVVEVEESLPALTADEDRLQQVVWNLLTNAVKFTPANGTIEVLAKSAEDSVKISVRDSGKGISAGFLPHVFDRFRQDDTSTTKSHAGLGLGLAIVRHLVELHGGSVGAESPGLGQGAVFTVTLPLRPPTPAEQLPLKPKASAPGQSPGARSGRLLAGLRVVVVDDQDDARDLLATVLEDAGAVVKQASSVRMALEVLSASELDVVVSDIGMPHEDGYSLIKSVRSDKGRDLPAVAVTAFARAEDRLRALQAGFQEHISKPIDPDALVAIVARLARR